MEVKHFFVTSDYCDTAQLPITGLAVGDSAIVTMGSGALTIVDLEGAGSLAAGTEYMFVAKNGNGDLEFSEPFTLAQITSYAKKTYSAGTQQVITLTPVAPSSQLEGDSCSIKLANVTNRTMSYDQYTIEEVNEDGSTISVATMCDNLVAAINGHSELSQKMTAADNTTNFTLTITDPDESWEVFDTSSDWTVTVTYTTANVPSVGTAAKVATMEEKLSTYKGVSTLIKKPWVYPASSVTSSYTYDIYVFTVTKPINQNFNALPDFNRKFDIVVASRNPVGTYVTAASLLYAALTA